MPGVEIVAHVLDGLRSGAWITTLHGLARTGCSRRSRWRRCWSRSCGSRRCNRSPPPASRSSSPSSPRRSRPVTCRSGSRRPPRSRDSSLCYPLWSWRRLEATQRYLNEELARLRAEPAVLPEAAATARYAVDAVDARLQAVRAATERLRNLRQFLTDIGMSMPDALLVADNAGRVLTANARAAEYLHAPSVGALQGRSARRRGRAAPDRRRPLLGARSPPRRRSASRGAARTAATCCSTSSRAPPTTGGASGSSCGSPTSPRSRKRSASASSCCASSRTTCARRRCRS